MLVKPLGQEDPPWRRSWKPTPVFLPGGSHGQRSPVAVVHSVTQSPKRLKQLKRKRKKKKKTEATYYVTAYHFKNVLLVLKCILKTCGPLLSK